MTGRLRRLTATVAITAVVLGLLGGAVVWAAARFVSAPLADDPYVLLALGSDMGPPRPGSALGGRADAIHLIVVSQQHQRISILSFPRDTLADVPGMGRTKINASLTRGPDVAVQAVEQLTGIDVDDWIVTGFAAFQSAVDAIGGVTVDVEGRLYDPKVDSRVIEPGPQHLGGWMALTYSRIRYGRPGGDFGRSAGQANVLMALHRRFHGEGLTLARIGELMQILLSHTATSIPPDRLFRLAGLALSIPPENVAARVVEGRSGSSGGASVVFLTDAGMRTIADVREDNVLGPVPPPQAP